MVYITVRYGENQHEIFNPKCKTYVLLKSIRNKCKCDRETDIELSDESGNVKNLRDPGMHHKYANEFLDEREKLVLLKVEKSNDDTPRITYTPLLQTDDGVLSEDFMARLALKGSETEKEHKRIRSSTRRREKAAAAEKEAKETTRQSSREKNNDKLKPGGKGDKRMSARSKR